MITMSAYDQSGQADLRTLTHVAYALYALAFVTGITAVAGFILALLKRDACRGTLYASHMTWLIRTFLIGLIALVAVGLATLLLGWIPLLGFLFLIAGGLAGAVIVVWYIYRIVKGWLALADGKAITDPGALL